MSLDRLSFSRTKIRECLVKRRLKVPVTTVGCARHKAPTKFMLSPRPGFDHFDALFYGPFDRPIQCGFEVKLIDGFARAPIPAVQTLAISKAKGSCDQRILLICAEE